jgi:kumamolisin
MDLTIARAKAAAFLATSLILAAYLPIFARADTAQLSNMVRLSGKTASGLRGEAFSSRVSSAQTVKLAVSLNLRNQADLEQTIARIYNPKDSLYHHFLSKDDLTATYSPTQADYDAVKNYLISNGLTVTGTDPNRLLIHVQGSAGTVEKALSLTLNNYTGADGSAYMRPNAEPAVSLDVADKISMIGGLNTSVKRLPNYIKRQSSAQDLESVIQNSSYVSATYGYGPVDIKTAYNLSSTTLTGSGQTIALVEFDGYKSSDITYYVKAFSSYFGSSYTPLVTFESVNGYDGTPTAHGGAAEVILDIEMALNLAPAATIEVFCDNQYTDNNFDLDMMEALYDNVTSGVISTSWGNTEVDAGDTSTDHAYYELFAAEGVSFFAASGDYG